MPSYSWSLAIPTPGLTPGSVYQGEGTPVEADFGYDVVTLPDLDVTFTPRRDALSVADAFARRLFTRRGLLWTDPNYGFDVRDYLNDEVTADTLQQIRAGVEAQAEQDERIVGVDVDVSYAYSTQTLRLAIVLYSDAGPFSMVLNVGDVNTDILVSETT